MKANMHKLILTTVGAIAILISQFPNGADAQQVPGRPATALAPLPIDAVPATQKAAEWVLTPDQDLVRVPLNKVVSVRLPGPVRNVVVANPDIADVILPQDGERAHVYVLARQVGSTTIVFEGANGEILFQGDIQVDVDVAGIQAAMAEMLPDEKITVVSHRNSVFIKGFVRSSVASNTAVNVARKFVADPVEVINNLEVLGSQQVIMKVTVAEVKRTAIKQLGLTTNINASGVNGLTLATVPTVIPTYASATITTAFGGLSPLTIKALESENLAKTLALYLTQ